MTSPESWVFRRYLPARGLGLLTVVMEGEIGRERIYREKEIKEVGEK